ncbi:nucleotidyl transferase AbiEii/AbiGii toxin family protein [Methyloversatilis sp.]|uniref:nucleotidyl transferase AbiEii/AbiGii toxin family protein n=1 Tax=Methyloversatilis sp. TaxID=2569862 RepID=UPI002736BF46|nr:nucleotidyl transferase AbiEii/AbiGii toxin family protein [Methyloversatilis sp.]MDP2870881.1 nucleotidyl transferase AbiEii/AbiGii toxin family protein [Methyloversatilis sp.]MDP3455682.1 nucleotidyl transferase AbiEii/AbiGii toxin family protein [Methyloversatilis sp.]MDP3577543.1 nucleotidyl transferase AbiEii/AbiGii toxin family protein [Methyloversatilis sp.]
MAGRSASRRWMLWRSQSRGECDAALPGELRAEATKQDFNLTLTHYGLERLLYSLSISPHSGNNLLKGALLFSLWFDPAHRTTRDVDLLELGPDDIGTAVAAFREICRIEV